MTDHHPTPDAPSDVALSPPEPGVFPYPGSKMKLASWVTDHLPAHDVYVEPFGGSGAVLLNKAPSDVEIFNDVDGDIVHFMTTLRDHADDLVAWLESTPFSRELHKRYAHAYYSGYRPADDVERAGRWFYLRNTQFAQKYTELSGFRLAASKNHATEYANRVDRLYAIRDRLRAVQIERLDYAELVDRVDGPDTCYYFDPPYLDVDALYTGHDGFDHQRFVDVLDAIEGDWVVSYTALPDGLGDAPDHHVVEREKRNTMRTGQGDWQKTDTERLVMNFDPGERRTFSAATQVGIDEIVGPRGGAGAASGGGD